MSLSLWRHPKTNQIRLYCELGYPVKAKVWVEPREVWTEQREVQYSADSIDGGRGILFDDFTLRYFAGSPIDFPRAIRGPTKLDSAIDMLNKAIGLEKRATLDEYPSWEDLLEMAGYQGK